MRESLRANKHRRHPEEVARVCARPSRRMEARPVFVAIPRDASATKSRSLLRMTVSLLLDQPNFLSNLVIAYCSCTGTGCESLYARTNTGVILRRSRAFARGRLEGWKHAPCLWPSFETRARRSRARSSG